MFTFLQQQQYTTTKFHMWNTNTTLYDHFRGHFWVC